VSSESRDYVQTTLSLYLQLPETPAQSSRLDRQLALEWFKQKIPLPVVETAFLLASARRLARDQKATRLGPIRSLHYFLPVLEEVRRTPPPDSYLPYLRRKVSAALARTKKGEAC
jgi:hypothetical protein